MNRITYSASDFDGQIIHAASTSELAERSARLGSECATWEVRALSQGALPAYAGYIVGGTFVDMRPAPSPAERCADIRRMIAERSMTREIEQHASLLVALAITAEGYDVRGRAGWGKPARSAAVLTCAML
jgi:hypothetical protein